jgi:hypothetical protein
MADTWNELVEESRQMVLRCCALERIELSPDLVATLAGNIAHFVQGRIEPRKRAEAAEAVLARLAECDPLRILRALEKYERYELSDDEDEYDGPVLSLELQELLWSRLRPFRVQEGPWPRDVIEAMEAEGLLRSPDAWRTLDEWADKGCYEYGCNLGLGWKTRETIEE